MPDADERASMPLSTAIRACKRRLRTRKMADSTGAELTGGTLIARSLVLRQLLRRHAIADDERTVGILLPPTCAAVATNLALSIDRRLTVNLNYTLSQELINSCIRQAKIRTVITSRKVMERFGFELDAKVVMLEDLRDLPTRWDKAVAAFQAFVLPTRTLERQLGIDQIKPDDPLTVVFTSGSTGDPKGAVLSHRNVGSNVLAVDGVIHTKPTDVLIGVLPLFHSFGYTSAMWSALMFDIGSVFHTNPLEAKVVGRLCRDHRGTILLATPMFLGAYLRRCEPEDFATLEVVATGGENLLPHLADEFEAKFGIRPIQGYGCTETSPMIAGNTPAGRARAAYGTLSREGTVGPALPGITVRVVDPESGQPLPPGSLGMLEATGPNLMLGYLDRPEETAKVIRDGWYVTGDLATIDADGFITIGGRVSRFAKIGGEMVPHLAVEEPLNELVGPDEDGMQRLVVVSVADRERGERLVVLHLPIEQTPEELVDTLAATGLPKLFLPALDSFYEVPELPMIGTGKLDLRAVQKLAEQMARSGAPSAVSAG
jgi:acyl-[acyl-carrier-protein]-phospholipid O-acyltransferase/long-chain-fatty-acid--[acyl-carrier-protein] ligase